MPCAKEYRALQPAVCDVLRKMDGVTLPPLREPLTHKTAETNPEKEDLALAQAGNAEGQHLRRVLGREPVRIVHRGCLKTAGRSRAIGRCESGAGATRRVL